MQQSDFVSPNTSEADSDESANSDARSEQRGTSVASDRTYGPTFAPNERWLDEHEGRTVELTYSDGETYEITIEAVDAGDE